MCTYTHASHFRIKKFGIPEREPQISREFSNENLAKSTWKTTASHFILGLKSKLPDNNLFVGWKTLYDTPFATRVSVHERLLLHLYMLRNERMECFSFYVELYIACNAVDVNAAAASRQITKHIFFRTVRCASSWNFEEINSKHFVKIPSRKACKLPF